MPDDSMFNALIRSRLTLRDSDPSLYNELESRMPLVTNHPESTAQAQGMATPQQVQSTAANVAQSAPQTAPAAPTPDAGQQPSQLGTLVSKLLEDLNKDNEKKAKPLGPDLFGNGNGGILGSGVSTSTALMYALGAAITSRMPQAQALQMTMQIGGLPGEFEAQKNKFAQDKVSTILSAINGQTAQENLKQRVIENQVKTGALTKAADSMKFIEDKLTNGETLSAQDKALMVVRSHAAGIPYEAIKGLVGSTDLASQIANFELTKRYFQGTDTNVSGTLDLPGGQKITVGNKTSANIDRNVDQKTRTILAAAKESNTPMTIEQARQTARTEAVADARARGVMLPAAVGQREGIQEAGVRTRERVQAEQKIGDLTQTQNQLDSIFRLSDKLITATSSNEAIRQSISLNAQGLLSSTNAGLYNSIKTGLADTLARTLGGQRGVLTDEDIARTTNLFPAFGDTKQTAMYKKGYLQNALNIAIDATNAAVDGKIVDRVELRKKYNAILNQLEDGLDPTKSKPNVAGKAVQ